MSKVIQLDLLIQIKKAKESALLYQKKISHMDKVTLLDEVIHFQNLKKKEGALTLEIIFLGQQLFQKLEEKAESESLKELAKSYLKHLHYELELILKKKA